MHDPMMTETPPNSSSTEEPRGSIAQLQRGRILITDLSIAWEYRLICHDPAYSLHRTGPLGWTIYRGSVQGGRPVGALMPWWRKGAPLSTWRLIALHRGQRLAEALHPSDLPRLLRLILAEDGLDKASCPDSTTTRNEREEVI